MQTALIELNRYAVFFTRHLQNIIYL
jgi:hypothetical protein